MSDASNDRGAKPPRTMFSLGRPGNRPRGAEDATEAVEPAGEAADAGVLLDSGYLCGSCEHPLPVGAAFCGECGTPVLGTVPDPSATVVGEQSPLTDLAVPDDAAAVHDTPPAPEGVAVADAPADAPPAEGEPTYVPPAVLYTDPAVQPEPLPAPTGAWGISAPTYGTAADETVVPPADAAAEAPVTAAADPTAPVATPDGAPVAEAPVAEAAADPYRAPAADPYAAPAADAAAPAGVVPGAVAGAEAGGATTPPAPMGVAGSPGAALPAPSKSKAPMFIGIAAALVVLLIIAGVVIAMAGKSDNSVQTAGKQSASSPTQPKDSTSTSDAPAETTTTANGNTTSTVAPTTAAPETTAVPQTTAAPVTVAPTNPAPTNPPTTPVAMPGSISASALPASVAKEQTFGTFLTNNGDQPASYALQITSGNGTISPASGQVGPGETVEVRITPAPGFEGNLSFGGIMQGQPGNRYSGTVNVRTN